MSKKIMPNVLPAPLHARIFGEATFMRAPFVPPQVEELGKIKADVAIIGVPFELCAVGIPGVSYGPRVIRLVSDSIMSYNIELDVDIAEELTVVDCGDVSIIPGNMEKSHKIVEEAVSRMVEAGALPIVLGGDHSITWPAFSAFYRHTKGKIGLIHFDRHHDTYKEYKGEKISMGSEITRIVELERVDPKNVVQIGVGTFQGRPAHCTAVELGLNVFYIWDVFGRGIMDVTRKAIEMARNGTEAVYLTVDIDVLDAAYAPATEVPTIGGLTTRQLVEAIHLIASAGIDAFDIVEVSGTGDPNLITARAASSVIAELLGSIALKKSRAPNSVDVADKTRRSLRSS